MIDFKETVRKRRVKANSNDSYQEVDVQFVSGKVNILEETYVVGD